MRLSPFVPTVRALLVRADPRLLHESRRTELPTILRGLARAVVPFPSPALQTHPLFAGDEGTDPSDRRPPSAALVQALDALPFAERLIGLHELHRETTSDRRATGLFYTPPWLSALVVARTAPETFSPDATVLDPSCGAGSFLVAALRARLRGELDLARRAALGSAFAMGTDTDSDALTIARVALSSVVLHEGDPGETELLWPGLRVVDPLHENDLEQASLVIGNPPYLDAKTRARVAPDEGAFLRGRFPELHGSFDLFVAFVLRALELARPGATIGLVLPDKLFTAGYASKLRRRLLEETTLDEAIDLTPASPFPEAAIFPWYVRLRTQRAPAGHTLSFASLTASFAVEPTSQPLQTALDVEGLRARAASPSRRALRPLGDRLSWQAGTAGFDAGRVLAGLVEGDPGGGAIPFAVTGSVDRYALTGGPLVFLKHRFSKPFLLASTELAASRWLLFRGAKLVLAGLGRRLEATFVETPLALGVATYGAPASPVDAWADLAIVNSAWATDAYLQRHGERRLSGGYFAVQRREISALPVPTLTPSEQDALGELARTRARATGDEASRLDAEIDAWIFALLEIPNETRSVILERTAEPPRRR